LKDIKTIL